MITKRIKVLFIATIFAFGSMTAGFATVRVQAVSENTVKKDAVPAPATDEVIPEKATIKYSGVDGDLSWSIDTDGLLTITGEGDWEDEPWQEYAEEIIEAEISIRGITDMSHMFFYEYSNLKKVDFTGTDTSAVTDIGNMFYGCSSLKKIDLSHWELQGCGKYASYLYIFEPEVVEPEYMVQGCSSLEEFCLPAKVKYSIILPKTDTSHVWKDASGNVCTETKENLATSMTYKKVPLVSGPETKGTTMKSDDLTSDTGKIPEDSSFTVTSNDPEKPTVAFDGVEDENAPAVEIPKSVVYNGVTYEVTTVSITDYTSKTDNAKYEVTGNQVDDLTIEYKEPADKKKASAVIPEYSTYKGIKFKVTSVAAKAFKGNKKLKNISIATSITTIGKDSFNGCTNLKTVTVGKSLRTIGNNAFKNCKKLTKVDIKSKRLETIGSGAFYKCSALTNLTFNSTKLKSIGKNAFKSCKKLTKIIIKSKKLKTVGKNALKGVNKKCVIKVPKAKVKAYTKLFAKKGQAKTVKVTK